MREYLHDGVQFVTRLIVCVCPSGPSGSVPLVHAGPFGPDPLASTGCVGRAPLQPIITAIISVQAGDIMCVVLFLVQCPTLFHEARSLMQLVLSKMVQARAAKRTTLKVCTRR